MEGLVKSSVIGGISTNGMGRDANVCSPSSGRGARGEQCIEVLRVKVVIGLAISPPTGIISSKIGYISTKSFGRGSAKVTKPFSVSRLRKGRRV